MAAKHSMDLTRGPVMKNLLIFAFPILLSNLLQQLYQCMAEVTDNDTAEAAVPKLMKLRPLIQSNIARHVTLKYTPVIRFEHDLNIVEGDNVLALLQQMEDEELLKGNQENGVE